MSDPNSGEKAAPSDKTAIVSGSVGGGSAAGQIGGRSAPAEKTMIAAGVKAPAKVEIDSGMLQPQAQSAPNDKTVAPIVARGTKPSSPPPSSQPTQAPGAAGTGQGGGSGLLST